jgi:hypothetical protein
VSFELTVPNANDARVTELLCATVDLKDIVRDIAVNFGHLYSVVLDDAELIDRIHKTSEQFKIGMVTHLYVKKPNGSTIGSWSGIYSTRLELV